ncbi:hypothetical protein OIU77_011387 [Salix suchowensis]|uniref:Uncharacterized protein n=1 Tax=Salix suchowensis TaxID=1278906 RepID=A0ABQ9A0F4_9ROSI|nr:hypothetical protein OIU77_011387 [Salix suchowensis]
MYALLLVAFVGHIDKHWGMENTWIAASPELVFCAWGFMGIFQGVERIWSRCPPSLEWE